MITFYLLLFLLFIPELQQLGGDAQGNFLGIIISHIQTDGAKKSTEFFLRQTRFPQIFLQLFPLCPASYYSYVGKFVGLQGRR